MTSSEQFRPEKRRLLLPGRSRSGAWPISASPVTSALIIGLAILISVYLSLGTLIGYYYTQSSEGVSVAAGSAPWALLVAALATTFFIIMMKKFHPASAEQPAGLMRRFGAFLIDCVIAIVTIGSIAGLLMVYIEFRRTGTFAWRYERNFTLPGESTLAAVVFCFLFLSLALYLAYPLTRKKQTIGCWLMSVLVESDDGGALSWKTSLLRVILGLWSLAAAWLTVPCATRDPQRRMWHDKKTHSRVVMVRD